jgi:hypothetical protein
LLEEELEEPEELEEFELEELEPVPTPRATSFRFFATDFAMFFLASVSVIIVRSPGAVQRSVSKFASALRSFFRRPSSTFIAIFREAVTPSVKRSSPMSSRTAKRNSSRSKTKKSLARQEQPQPQH